MNFLRRFAETFPMWSQDPRKPRIISRSGRECRSDKIITIINYIWSHCIATSSSKLMGRRELNQVFPIKSNLGGNSKCSCFIQIIEMAHPEQDPCMLNCNGVNTMGTFSGLLLFLTFCYFIYTIGYLYVNHGKSTQCFVIKTWLVCTSGNNRRNCTSNYKKLPCLSVCLSVTKIQKIQSSFVRFFVRSFVHI